MESVAFIQWCLDHLNYWTITVSYTHLTLPTIA